jgi:hypothetical protein
MVKKNQSNTHVHKSGGGIVYNMYNSIDLDLFIYRVL